MTLTSFIGVLRYCTSAGPGDALKAAVASMWVLTCSWAAAAEYKQISASRPELCGTFLDVLKTQYPDFPPACGLSGLDARGIRAAEWRKLNPTENFDLLKDIATHSGRREMGSSWEKQIAADTQQGKLCLWSAMEDIDNDAAADTLLSRGDCTCDPRQSSNWYRRPRTQYVFDPSKREILWGELKKNSLLSSSRDILAFQGKTYSLSMGGVTYEPYFDASDRTRKLILQLDYLGGPDAAGPRAGICRYVFRRNSKE